MQYTDTTKVRTVEAQTCHTPMVYVPPVLDNLSPPGWQFGNVGYTSLFERKLDNGDGSRSAWKSWEHYRASSNLAGPGGVRVTATGFGRYPTSQFFSGDCSIPCVFVSNVYGGPGSTNYGLAKYYDPREDGGFIPPPKNLDELEVMAYHAMAPTIKPSLSIINSIIELKDMKTLKGTVENVSSLFSKLARLGKSKDTLRSLLRSSSDVYLQHMFNLRPLVSDVQDIFTALSRTERRMNDLMSRAGRPQCAHFTRAFAEYENTSESTEPELISTTSEPLWASAGNFGYGFAFSRSVERSVFYRPTVFHAQLEYAFSYSQLQLEHARVLSFLDAFGVNLNPAIIWNAIPYSFIVDWVFGVSRYLNESRIGNMDPTIHIQRYLWSVSRYRMIDVKNRIRFATSSSGNLGTPQVVTLPVMTETAYRRQVSSPKVALLRASGLTLVESSLAAALVTSRKSRKRPRSG